MNRLKKRYIQIKYKGHILNLEVLKYIGGYRTAIQAYLETGEPYDTITINIPSYDVDFSDEYIFLNTNHMPDIDKVLSEAGMIEVIPGIRIQSGYYTYPVARWLR